MSDPQTYSDDNHDPLDPIGPAFASFARQQGPALRPAGLAPVRATVRRRRTGRVAATVAAVAVAAIAIPVGLWPRAGTGAADPGAATSTATVGPATSAPATSGPATSGPVSSASATPSTAASSGLTGEYAPCRGDQLKGTSTAGGAIANQPWSVIVLTNTAAQPCRLHGYAGLTARGHRGFGDSGTTTSLPVTLTQGGDYVHPDPGPSDINLGPGGSASFDIGTLTALDDEYTLTEVLVVVPGSTTRVSVMVTMSAMARHGGPIPISVGAFVAGSAGPPTY